MQAIDQTTQDTINDLVGNSHGNFARVQELVEAHPELVNANAVWNETPLQAATHMGNRKISEYLLDHGAPLDVYAAAMLGRRDDVMSFLAANPELAKGRWVHGMPSLYFPATSGQIDMAEILLQHGADVNDGAGEHTALHAAALFGRTDMVRWLLDHGADTGATDYENKTPLDRAEERGNEDIAALLRDKGSS